MAAGGALNECVQPLYPAAQALNNRPYPLIQRPQPLYRPPQPLIRCPQPLIWPKKRGNAKKRGKRMPAYSFRYFVAPSWRERFSALLRQSAMIVLKLWSSSDCSPAAVVPPGLVTFLRRIAGSSPVFCNIEAAP